MNSLMRSVLWLGGIILVVSVALALIAFGQERTPGMPVVREPVAPPSVTADPACEAARARFWEQNPEVLLTLADCGPFFRPRSQAGELPDGPFDLRAEPDPDAE